MRSQFEASVSAQGSVTTWSKLMTTMPASQAFLIVGLSAESEAASTRMASGFWRMMLFSELICAWTVPSATSMCSSTRPLSGPLSTDTWATRCICWRQSLPTKLLER